MTYLMAMTLSVLEGRFPIVSLIHKQFFIFYTFGIAYRVAITGEDRNFKFGTDVKRNKS